MSAEERRRREEIRRRNERRRSEDRRSYEERSAVRREPEDYGERRRPSKKEVRRQKEELRRKRKRKRIILLVSELVILAVLCVVAYGVMKLDKIDYTKLDKGKLEVYRDTGPYTNIALFGLDSRDGEIDGGVRSDCMMVASINNKTDEVKIISVYRDTLLKQEDGEFAKANSAYARGGPQAAIALMNRNLDLDIQNYISVNFNSLVDIIDALGGIEIELTEEERIHMNNYQVETAEVVGQAVQEVEEAGLQKLNGVQAVSYSRIRYTDGGDYKRAERQRLVLQKMAEKAQKANLLTLNKLLDKVLPQISTSFSQAQLLGMATNALSYKIGEMKGFPFEVAGTDKIAGDKASYVIPVGIANNVTQLHRFLFDEENYVPSDIVQSISNEVSELSGIYPENE
ncbi:LCP family protein [Faecalicatena sp. Marseille-Q4148]|nr:LCP family protein [Faecalicatena sp. Marseille-Q4148]